MTLGVSCWYWFIIWPYCGTSSINYYSRCVAAVPDAFDKNNLVMSVYWHLLLLGSGNFWIVFFLNLNKEYDSPFCKISLILVVANAEVKSAQSFI